MRELYRRLAFTVLVQNTDDHLRNLGFLYRGNGKWSLSPEFDVSPVPELGTTLKTAISPDNGNALDINAVVKVAAYFGLGWDEADALLAMAMRILDEWRGIDTRLGMRSSDFRAVAPASDNAQVERAIAMAATKLPGVTGT